MKKGMVSNHPLSNLDFDQDYFFFLAVVFLAVDFVAVFFAVVFFAVAMVLVLLS
jgi:hypothetical protein